MRRIKNFLLLYLIIPILDKILGTSIFFYFKQIKKMNNWPIEKVRDWQNQKVQELIKHFYYNSDYYHELFNRLSISHSDIKTVNDLKKIPPINKQTLINNYDKIIPRNINKIKHKKAKTGGSTGKTLSFLLDNKSWSYTTAAKIFAWQTTNYLYGDRYAALGSSSLFPTKKKSLKHVLYFALRNGIPLNGMNLSDVKISEYVNILKKKKVKYLYGYAASLFLIAKYVNNHNIKLHIKGCFPTSEILLDSYRLEMEKAFGCFVMDGYGARDGGINAFEICSGYYNIGYNSFAELGDEYSENKGTLLCTDLLNYSFPFIRYEIGDEVSMPGDDFKSNYNGQIFTKIFGRESNIIHLKNGKILTGVGFAILLKHFNINAFRIKQINDLKIVIEIEKNICYTSKDENDILNSFKKHTGDDCCIEIIYVNKFKIEPNGKRLYFINS